MAKRLLTGILPLLATIIAGCAGTREPAGRLTAAPAPARQVSSAEGQLRTYLDAYNSGDVATLTDFFATRYALTALGNSTPAARAANIVETRAFTGPLRLYSVEPAGANGLVALLQSTVTEEWFKLEFETAAEPPNAVIKSEMNFTDRPAAAVETAPLDDAALALEARTFAEGLHRHSPFRGAFVLANAARPLVEWRAPPAGDREAVPVLLDMASTGKLFTIVAIAQLEQEGRLSLTDPIGRFLPDYPNQDAARNVTIGRLLTHSAGVPDYMENPAYQTAKNAAGGRLANTSDYLPFFAAAPLEYRPGTRASYSNSGYVLLGLIVERLSGQRFPDYVARRIFRPAGMTETPVDSVRPAGGEMSTVGDLLNFGRALREARLLNAEQTARILSPVIAREGREGVNAYGVEVSTEGGITSFGHGGSAPGVGARLAIYPTSGHYFAVLVEGDDAAARRLADKARRLIARAAVRPTL